MKNVKVSRLYQGDEFEYKGQKHVVVNTIVGFGTEVGAKSVKTGQFVRIHRDVVVATE